MADPAAQPSEETPAASELSVPSEAEIEARIQREVQARFAGYQSAQDKRLAAAEKRIKELSKATLSEREQEEQDQSELEAEAEKLRRENALLRAGQKYGPEVVADFARLLEAEQVEDQLEMISKWRSPAGNIPVPQTTPQAPPAPVDPNRPPRAPDSADTREMDQTTADRILAPLRTQRWPGYEKP